MTIPLLASSFSITSATLIGLTIYLVTIGLDYFPESWTIKLLRIVLALMVLVEILHDINYAVTDVRLILDAWPMQHRGDFRTKDDIIASLASHVQPMAQDDLCPFCRGPYQEPLELPCQHLYCKACVGILIDNGLEKCSLCYRRYYAANGTVLTVKLRSEGIRAKYGLKCGLICWVLHAICLLVVLVCWDRLHGDFRYAEVVAYRYFFLACFIGSYFTQVMLVAEMLDCIEDFREDWWKEVHNCIGWKDHQGPLDSMAAVITVAFAMIVMLWVFSR